MERCECVLGSLRTGVPHTQVVTSVLLQCYLCLQCKWTPWVFLSWWIFTAWCPEGLGGGAECLSSCRMINDKAEGRFEVLPLSLPDSHSLWDKESSSSALKMLR